MEKPLTGHMKATREPLSLEEYRQAGGYEGLRAALRMSPQEVQEVVKASGLRGRGGAGFPTGQKWGFVDISERQRKPTYFCVNADEMEPGTMKDRVLLEGDPHQILEGAAICAHAIRAEEIYILIRWAYRQAYAALAAAIAEAEQAGLIGAQAGPDGYRVKVHIHPSAGRYMCGEESGLLDVLEGKRAVPRTKPPYPQAVGLWGKPTVVDNVETVCCVTHILRHGAQWFRALARTDDAGTKLYGASGRVKKPGVWELPMGTTLSELLLNHAGGMTEGYAFRAVLPGGASTAFLTEEHLCAPMDFNNMEAIGSRLGTGTLIVLDDRTCPVGVLYSLLSFFARESCGYCTPCREGLPWVVRLLAAIERGEGRREDLELLEHHVNMIRMHRTFCALAPGAMMPLQSGLQLFREDLERHISEQRCPWRM
jgi:NADH-quinone oxidoreductase subunit F